MTSLQEIEILLLLVTSVGVTDMPAVMNASTWTAFAAFALVVVLLTLRRARKPLPRRISSPRDTLLPQISSEQAAALPYPPGLLPGARDVTTPYGVMRVYEWGPKDGDKVLFIHGDTTPTPMLGPIAHNLSNRGCRVMMFGMSTRLRSVYSETLAATVRTHDHVTYADYAWDQRPLG